MILGKLNKLWSHIESDVNYILTHKDAEKDFLVNVFILAGFGIACCMIWFILLVKKYGLTLGWGIFFLALFVFCGWAVVEGVIKPVKEWWPDDNESKK